MAIKRTLQQWSVEDSTELYGIRNWGAGYFGVSPEGEVSDLSFQAENKGVAVSVPEVIRGMRERGYDMPVLLRIENILDSQITLLHESFRKAIASLGYKGEYRGVFPIKVNQQQHTVEKIAQFGSRFHHGLEVGSKAELISAISQLKDPEACLICNGYKDEEFIDLGLSAVRMGFKCIFVMEMPGELELILERSAALGVRPLLGVRVKLITKGSGHWAGSCGERSAFGLTTAQVVDIVDTLKQHDMLDCLQLLHYHLGSQVPNIRDIRTAVMESTRVYAGLVQEGAKMGYLDLGGGLARGLRRLAHQLCEQPQLFDGRILYRRRGSGHDHPRPAGHRTPAHRYGIGPRHRGLLFHPPVQHPRREHRRNGREHPRCPARRRAGTGGQPP